MSNVKVAVRVRPLSEKEREKNAKFIVDVSGDTVSVENIKVDGQSDFGDSRERVKNFTFDYCYDSTVEPSSPAFASQELVFQDLGTEVLQAAVEGYNACLFAYGQTSTGKTYTMMGGQEDAGLIPRICEGLFSHVDNFVDQENLSFHVKISYLEIYNERVRDLLRPSLLKKNEKYTLKVREHPKDGPYVQDLSTHFINDNQQIQAILERGNEYRTTASTYMHDHSSRSHAIVTIEFTQAKLEDDLPHEIVSKLHLVDLAGSERADPNYGSGYKGRLREGSNINKSLVTLGNVIKALAERSILSCSTDSLGASMASVQSSPGGDGATPKKRLPYIPYRDSVLTWLLKDSLGGNSKTIMISTITPASMYYNETLSTLRYAQRAKSIINKPKINEDPNVSLIRDLRREIERLREMLVSTRMGNSRSSLNEIIFLLPPSIQKMHDIDMDSDQGDSFLQLPDSNSVLAEKLQENENMVDKLTQTWIDKWREAHEAIRDSDLSIRGLRGKSNSMGVLIESQMPHLVGMDDDILSTGVTIYYLKEGKTLLGREDADREQDIVLSGPSAQKEHCFIKNMLGNVILHPNRGANCAINGIDCRGPTRLKQGDYILLGKTNMFRYNNPAEAAKLRISRQNLAVAGAVSQESLDLCDPSSPDTERPVHPLYAHCDASEFCHQLEKDFDSDTKRIEEAKRELQRVRDEHKKAEEERQLREEELWRLHESHKQEIEQQRRSLTEIADENLLQHQRAEEELTYARDCLQQERQAFQQYLQDELAKVQKGQTSSESQTEVAVVRTAEVGCDQELQDIERRKESLQGQIKALAQGELIRRLSYRETEQRLLEEAEEIEDQYQTTQEQLNAELEQLEQVEKEYRTGDRSQLQDITHADDDLSELDRQQEQLHLYIEEKQGLMQVGLDVPRPLRSACSEEVLTDTQNSSLGFPYRASSLLALKQGSEGDLPNLSTRLSINSSLNITSLDSIPDSVESMDTSSSPQTSTSSRGTPTGTRKRSTRSPASDTLTSGAKEVTSRLYSAPPPKFKYEPKQKSKVVPKTDPVRKRDGQVGKGASTGASKNISSTDSKKGSDDRKTKTTSLRKSKSPSPGRASAPLPGRQTSPVSGGQASPSPGKPATPLQKRQKALLPESAGKGGDQSKKRTGVCGSPGPLSEGTKRVRHSSDESGVIHRLRQSVSQPILSRALISNKVALPTKLRPITSATSLASVPEAMGEETEALDHGQVSDSLVVRRRKKRQFDEDDTRRHSEPVGESFADAFDKYTKEMEANIEIPGILLHHDSSSEQIWARQHSSGVSDSDEASSSDNTNHSDINVGTSNRQNGQSFHVIPSTANLEVTSFMQPDQQVATVQQEECCTMAGDSTARECVNNTVGSSVDGPLPGNPTDNQCNGSVTCDIPTEQVEVTLEIKPCKVDDNVFRNDLEYQQEGGVRSVELDSDSGFYPESSDNFESSGAHSFAGSINNALSRSNIGSEVDPQGSALQASQTEVPGAVSMDSDRPALTCTEESDIMEVSLTSPADVSLHLSESQDSESDSGNHGRKREHDSSMGDFQVEIPPKCKKEEKLDSDNVYLTSPGQDHMEIVVPEHGSSQNNPQSYTQSWNAPFTLNPNFQASSGFVVCDILQDAAKTMSAELDGAQRSYSSDSLEDADSLDGSRPRTTKEQELSDSLEDSDVDEKERKSKLRKKGEQQNNTGFLQGEQQNDTGFLQGEQKTDTEFLQGEQKHDTGFLQREQKTDTGFLLAKQQNDTGFLQREQKTDTGFLQGADEPQGCTPCKEEHSQTENNENFSTESDSCLNNTVIEIQSNTQSSTRKEQNHSDFKLCESVTTTDIEKEMLNSDKKPNLSQSDVDIFSTPVSDNMTGDKMVTLTKSDVNICSTQGNACNIDNTTTSSVTDTVDNTTTSSVTDTVDNTTTSSVTDTVDNTTTSSVTDTVDNTTTSSVTDTVDNTTTSSVTDTVDNTTTSSVTDTIDNTTTSSVTDTVDNTTTSSVTDTVDNTTTSSVTDTVDNTTTSSVTDTVDNTTTSSVTDTVDNTTTSSVTDTVDNTTTSSVTDTVDNTTTSSVTDTIDNTTKSSATSTGDVTTTPSTSSSTDDTTTHTAETTGDQATLVDCPARSSDDTTQIEYPARSSDDTIQVDYPARSSDDTTQIEYPARSSDDTTQVDYPARSSDDTTQIESSVNTDDVHFQSKGAEALEILVCHSQTLTSVHPGEVESAATELSGYPNEHDSCPSEVSVLVCPGELDSPRVDITSLSVTSSNADTVLPVNSQVQVKSDDISQHVNHSRGEVSIGVDEQQMELGEECLSVTSVCDTDTPRGQVISVTEATPTQHYPDTNQTQQDILVVSDPSTFTPIKCNKDDSSSQTNPSSDMNFKPISNAVEESHDQVPDQSSTQSLCIATTPHLLTPGMEEEENVGGASDCSHDSIQELQEQLQQLEEFPGQRGVGANPPLSLSRRATRHRAMIRQKRRGVEESDDFSPESGDSVGSGNASKPSSRPDSASKRRRRIIKSKSDRRSNLKAPSSEDYVNSESDDVCSDDSRVANESGDLKDVQPDISDESDPSVTYSDFAQQLSTALDEQKEYIAEHDSVSQKTQACDCEDITGTDLNPDRTGSEEEFKMDGHHMNGISYHGEDTKRGAIPKKSKRFKQRKSNGSSTSDLDTDMRPSSRTPSETRDMEQQTDVSWLEFPDISPSPTRRKSPVLHISPLSVWNSGDRGVKTSEGPHGSGGVNVSMDSRHIKKTKRTKPVKLEFTSPDVWSADTWVENFASSEKVDADISSDSDDDHAYVMETEVFSPQSPTACDKFFDDEDTSDTREDSNSVKYYVTINEENTNISYNVDRTEYKTYSLRSQIQPNELTMSIPESININLTATNTHMSESRHTSSNSQRVYLNNSDQRASSPEQNVVVSERSFRTVHEASRDEDSVVERRFEEEASASYLELCPGTSTPHPQNISTETGDINKNDVLSPRESDTTSDYGTMIMDNRRDFMSFTLDSGDEEGSLASGYKSQNDNQENSPLDDKVFALPSGNTDLLLAEMGSVPAVNSEDVDSISQDGHHVCPSEQISRRNVVAGTQHHPCRPEMVSNVLCSEQIGANSLSDDSSDVEDSQFVEAENVPHSTNVAQQVIGALARMSSLAGIKQEDSEDLTVSLDQNKGPESVSSDSSIYKTPQQSPRDDEEGDTAAIENVEIPDQPQAPQLSKCMKNKEALNPALQSPSKTVSEHKTVPVTTDPQAVPCARRKTVDDSSVREDLKRELQQKLARLQKHVRSLSDSAISSDYTDGDSTSVSPRGSRLYESDKTLRGGLFVDQTDSRYPEDIRVMVTQTRTQFDPASSGQPFSSTVHRLLDIDNKTPKKSPLQDSGNVFDDSDLGEQVEDAIVPVRVVKEDMRMFVPIVKDDEDIKSDDIMNASAIADSRSLSPGEFNMLSASCSSGDIFESVGSGSSDLEEVYRINNMEDQSDDGIVPRSLPSTQRSVKKEKSPSMSDITSPRCDRDLKRSMSEANVDDFEEITSSESSNDSIVFVFMGQSHTTESMEKLQNEYNPLPFGNDSDPVYHPLNTTTGESTSSQSQLDSESPISKFEEQTSDYDVVKSEENGSIHEGQITLECKDEPKPPVQSSPDHTGECGSKHYDDDDNEPLRHRFGIDEAVLPIPERSVSSDNIPKQTMSNLTVHRSRSTDLLEANPTENPNDPSNNEGIFPPNVDYGFWDDDHHGYHGDVVVVEEYFSDDSDSKKKNRDDMDKSQDRFIDEEHIASEEITYSELSPTHHEGNQRVSSETIDYNGNMHDTTEMLEKEKQYVDELYTVPITGSSDTSRRQESCAIRDPAVSEDDLQTRLTDVGTQTEVIERLVGVQLESQVLPALASPYRAQSMGDINPADSSITLTLPEGTDNWENLSHMVIESTTLINNINQKIAGANTTPCSSKETLNSESISTVSGPAHIQTNMHMDDTTQTTRSLTDLHNLAVQTDDEWMPYDREDSPDNSNDSTQTDTDITRPRELSETETTDLIPLVVDVPVDYDRVFPPEPSKEMSSQTSPDTTVDTIDTSMQTDEFEKVLSRLSHALKNDDSEAEEIEEEIKSSNVDGVNAQKTLKLSSGHVTSRVQDQAVVEYNKQEQQHMRKHNSKQDHTQTVIIERQSVIETEANVPDMDVTNAEMEALKAEHVKMMESLKKAAEGRKIRTHDLKARLEKQTHLEKGPVGDRSSGMSVRYTDESSTDTMHDDQNMTSWHETHLSSDISSKYDSSRYVQKDDTLEQIETSVHTEKEIEHVYDQSADLDSIFKNNHQYLGSNDNLENIDDLLVESDSPVSTKSGKGKRRKEGSVVRGSPAEIVEDIISPVCKSNQQTMLPTVGAEEATHVTTEVSRLDSLSSVTSEGTLLGEEVSHFLNDESDGRLQIVKDDSRFGAENRTLLARNSVTSVTSETVNEAIRDREGSPQLKTPPNSPVALSNEESRNTQYRKPQPYRRSPEIQPNYLATLRNQPPVTKQTETTGKISTGVEVSVDSSDDFTQTDLQSLKLDLSEFNVDSNTHSETRKVRIQNNPSIKSELSRLQKERVEIIELLSMNYLPASLTVELLEAKLNYCIGQTDTLLKTLEETWDRADFNVKEIHDHRHTEITREYVTNYRYDLQKSKRDIQICKEKMHRTVQQGVGRGRTLTRNRDIAKWKRLEEIEAFKAERFMEQQNYERARSFSPLKKVPPYENDKFSRSVSPSSLETSPRLMTPKQHREHLVDLRRSLVEVTERDEHAYRASRSCSPQLSHYDDTDRIHSPRSSSYNCSPQTSPVHRRYSPHLSPEHHYLQRTPISPRASPRTSPDRHYSPNMSPEHQRYRTDYGSTSSLSVPDQHTLSVSPRSYSQSPARTYTQNKPDLYNGSYLTPRVASASPHPIPVSTPRRPRSSLDSSRDGELRGHDQLYALQDTRDLFRDMQEARMQNQQEITRAQNTLLQSTRNYSGMRSRTSSNASSRRSYSSYRDYARDLIEGSQRSIHGVVSGSYELYDDTTHHGRSTGVISPPSSVVSDLESLPDSILSEQYATPSHLNTDPSFIRTRPINSTDIKCRIRKQRKIPLTS